MRSVLLVKESWLRGIPPGASFFSWRRSLTPAQDTDLIAAAMRRFFVIDEAIPVAPSLGKVSPSHPVTG